MRGAGMRGVAWLGGGRGGGGAGREWGGTEAPSELGSSGERVEGAGLDGARACPRGGVSPETSAGPPRRRGAG